MSRQNGLWLALRVYRIWTIWHVEIMVYVTLNTSTDRSTSLKLKKQCIS